jgi:hypothetical protein
MSVKVHPSNVQNETIEDAGPVSPRHRRRPARALLDRSLICPIVGRCDGLEAVDARSEAIMRAPRLFGDPAQCQSRG